MLRFSVEVPLRCFMRSSSHDWSRSNKTLKPPRPPGKNALLSYLALWGLRAGSSPLLIVGVLLCHRPALIKKWHLDLVLAGIEVIFFTVASVELCFGFWMRILLIPPQWFSCGRAAHTQSQGLFSFSRCPASQEAGGAAGAGRGQSPDR